MSASGFHLGERRRNDGIGMTMAETVICLQQGDDLHMRFALLLPDDVLPMLDRLSIGLLDRREIGGRALDLVCRSFRSLPDRCRREIFREMRHGAHDRIRRETAQRTKRTELHGVAEILQQHLVLLRLDAAGDLVDRLDAACRTDAAGVHLPQLSTAQNSMAKRACFSISAVSSKTTTPAWPIRPPAAVKAS